MNFMQSAEAVGTGQDYGQIWLSSRSINSYGGLTRGRGITESVHLQCIMCKCAGIHDAMTTMTDMKATACEQHIELGKSRCKCDFRDLLKIQEWFDQHDHLI